MRNLWGNLAIQLGDMGHETYILDIKSSINHTLLDPYIDSIIEIDESSASNLSPKTTHEANIIDFNNRHRNMPMSEIRGKAYGINKAFENYDIDIVIMWNELEIGKIIADRHKIQTYHLENGYFPNTLQIDSCGVNRNSSTANLSYKEIVHYDRGSDFSYDPVVPLVDISDPSWTDYLKASKKKTRSDGIRSFSRQVKIRLTPESNQIYTTGVDVINSIPNRYVFIPLQVHDDTQVLYNSEYVNDMYSFLDIVYTSIKQTDPDISIIVKEHPADVGRIDYTQLRHRYPDIVWLREYPIQELIRNAEAVVTLNSSVGLQAITEYTPVTTVGHSMYDMHPYVYSSNVSDDISQKISDALSAEINPDIVDPFIQSFKNNIFVDWNNNNLQKETIKKLINIILD